VFQLVFQAGTWKENILYAFQGGIDGSTPGSLLLGPGGTVYGTSIYGGTGDCTSAGCGTVFQFTPGQPGSAWTKQVIHDFQNNRDGIFPAALIADQAGNLYGVTDGGGLFSSCCGIVFQLTPPAHPGGTWTKTTLYAFKGVLPKVPIGDGAGPLGIAFDSAGNLYGTTASGGYCQQFEGGSCFGIVFQLTPPPLPGGAWNENILHRFAPIEQNPVSGVAVDKNGAVYGTTYQEAFRVAPVGGIFVETILHTFQFGNSDGYYPYGGVIVDQSGNVFGTTIGGGQTFNGTVYELQPPAQKGQPWTETLLWQFVGGTDGSAPDAPVMIGNDGALYGTTLRGGNQGCQIDGGVGCGTVFRVTH
jgi:hypothetical protein